MADQWTCQASIVTIATPWVTLFGEHWRDDQGHDLEYWRVERAHSVIVIPVQGDQLLLAQQQFRPGVDRLTLDFPGGRLPEGMSPLDAAPLILEKELGVVEQDIASLRMLNDAGWIINSSFSNQLLFGVVAHIHTATNVPAGMLGMQVTCDTNGIKTLLQHLDCLQCRAVLQEFYFQQW